MEFFDFFRPVGITKIILADLPTHVQFRWGSKSAIIIVNQREFEKLSPAVRYFVIMHEVGHIKTMQLFATKASELDEKKADEYALKECAKVGFWFQSAEEARQKFHEELNQF